MHRERVSAVTLVQIGCSGIGPLALALKANSTLRTLTLHQAIYNATRRNAWPHRRIAQPRACVHLRLSCMRALVRAHARTRGGLRDVHANKRGRKTLCRMRLARGGPWRWPRCCSTTTLSRRSPSDGTALCPPARTPPLHAHTHTHKHTHTHTHTHTHHPHAHTHTRTHAHTHTHTLLSPCTTCTGTAHIGSHPTPCVPNGQLARRCRRHRARKAAAGTRSVTAHRHRPIAAVRSSCGMGGAAFDCFPARGGAN